MQKLLVSILNGICSLVYCDRCSIFLVDEEKQELYSYLFDYQPGVFLFNHYLLLRFFMNFFLKKTNKKSG